MSKRVHLIHQSRFGQPTTVVELEDDEADKAVKSGAGELAADQVVYNHEDEMPADVKAEAYEQKAAADAAAAGDYRQVMVRTQATAAHKAASDEKKKGAKKSA